MKTLRGFLDGQARLLNQGREMEDIRDNIYAHCEALKQIAGQLCKGASPVGTGMNPSGVHHTDVTEMRAENARLRDELGECQHEQERLRQQITVFSTEREQLERKAESLLLSKETLEEELAGLKIASDGKDLSIKQLKSEKADLETANERQRGAFRRSLGLLFPSYVLEESEGALKSLFEALDEGQLQNMSASDRRQLSALLFFGVLRSALDGVSLPLKFETGSQGRRILDTLRSLGEFIAQSAEAPAQAEKMLEFWANKVIASNSIFTDTFSIEVPFIGQAFNSAVMMPSDPDAFLSEVSGVHGWAILTQDRSSALAKALVD